MQRCNLKYLDRDQYQCLMHWQKTMTGNPPTAWRVVNTYGAVIAAVVSFGAATACCFELIWQRIPKFKRTDNSLSCPSYSVITDTVPYFAVLLLLYTCPFSSTGTFFRSQDFQTPNVHDQTHNGQRSASFQARGRNSFTTSDILLLRQLWNFS